MQPRPSSKPAAGLSPRSPSVRHHQVSSVIRFELLFRAINARRCHPTLPRRDCYSEKCFSRGSVRTADLGVISCVSPVINVRSERDQSALLRKFRVLGQNEVISRWESCTIDLRRYFAEFILREGGEHVTHCFFFSFWFLFTFIYFYV